MKEFKVKEINVILGNRIRERRVILHITREKLAEIIDVSPRFLAELESGKTGASLSTLKALCIALDTTADYLLGLNDCPDTADFGTLVNKLGSLDKKYYYVVAELIENLKQI